ncbi:serine hydrolase [Patescibacteria group bacterium]|nr:serine hydrolase [Patescibacteria group bacterium]MBU1705884.1 serine hydrolase [Patescibacteria group bacterium]
MVFRLVAQLVLATSLLQMFPPDTALIEMAATLPEAGERVQTAAVFEAMDLLGRDFPESKDAALEPVKLDPNSIGVVTSAVSATVVDRATGKILFEKNSAEPRSIGSLVKLMTALVFLDGNPDLAARASLQSEDLRSGATQHIQVADEITIRDLLHASLIGSDNSATAALVRLSGLSLGDFVARMNEKAAALGMQNTTFVDSTGLSSENRSVVHDIVKLIDWAMANEIIRTATQLPAAVFTGSSGRAYYIASTDELLGSFLNQDPYKIVGGKTGFLPEAGYCFGSLISENNVHEIIVVVLGSYTKDGRFQDAKALAAWTFKTFDWPDELASQEL